jgi:hypothetical protein
MLFHDASARVCINGKTSDPFKISQGVRQGYPLVPYLFLIIGKFLNVSIKKEVTRGRIQGISIPGAME